MNRFKIRVWDNKRKCYLGEIEKTVIAEDGTEYTFPAWMIPNEGIITLVGIDRNPERFVKEQGTTAEDKNGKQIFEGDIVKTIWHEHIPWTGLTEPVEHCFEVYCHGIGLSIRNIRTKINHIMWKSIDYEVIGNIHEVQE